MDSYSELWRLKIPTVAHHIVLCKACRDNMFHMRPIRKYKDKTIINFILCSRCTDTNLKNYDLTYEPRQELIENEKIYWKLIAPSNTYTVSVCSDCNRDTEVEQVGDKVHLNFIMCNSCVSRNIEKYDLSSFSKNKK